MSKSARILFVTVITTLLVVGVVGVTYYFWLISNNQSSLFTTTEQSATQLAVDSADNNDLALVGYSESLPVIATVKPAQIEGDGLMPNGYSYTLSITSPQPVTGITIQLTSPITLFSATESNGIFTLPDTLSGMINSQMTTSQGTKIQLAAITMPPAEPISIEALTEGIMFTTGLMAQAEVLLGTIELVHSDNSITFGKIVGTDQPAWINTPVPDTSQIENTTGL